MVRVALVVLLALVTAPGGGAAPAAHNPISFTDPPGDSGSGPDITGVTISNTSARVISFQVAIANTTILPDNHFVGVFIDADRQPSTGPFGGFEYSIQTAGALGDALLGLWNGSTYATVVARSLVKIWVSGGTMTFQIANSDLANTTAFTSWAATEVLPTEGDWDDVAPDGTAVFSYTLSAPHITAATARFSPAAPRAGRRLTVTGVTLQYGANDQPPAATVRCRATLGGKALRGSGRGGCTFSIPRSAKGKRLVVTITAADSWGGSRTLRRTFRVR